MFCEECGKQIPDDSKFCDGCGAPVKPMQEAEPPYGKPLNEERQAYGGHVNKPMPVQNPYEGAGYRQTYENPGYGYHMEPGYNGEEGNQKKGRLATVLIVVLGLVAVALIGVLIFLGIRTFGGKKDGGGESPAVAEETESSEEMSGTETLEESRQETNHPETVPSSQETPAPTLPTIAASSSEVPSSEAVSEYILPTSNSAYLTEADLVGLSKEELRLARNEIYARHGRKFKDAALNEYFMSKSWYVPLIDPGNFNENVFNDYETANRKLIADYEKKMGY